MMKHCIIFVILLFVVFTNFLHSETFSHSYLDSVLQLYVNDGLVDYEGIKVLPRLFDMYIQQISSVSKQEFESWTSDEQKAFWINVYNAYFFRIISRNYPIKWGNIFAQAQYPKNCIYQIKNFHKQPLELPINPELNLEFLKKEILLEEFKDPRVLFALCDGTMSGPLLPKVSFKTDQLNEQLDRRVRAFLSNPGKVKFDTLKNKLYLSYIFDEYKQCFPSPTGRWDDEFKSGIEPENSPQVQRLKTAIVELKEKIETMRMRKFDGAGIDSMGSADVKASPSVKIAQKARSDTAEISKNTTGENKDLDSEFVRELGAAPIKNETKRLQQVAHEDSVGKAPSELYQEKKRQHEEAIRFEEKRLQELERDLRKRIAFITKKGERNLIKYNQKYHGFIYFLMHYLPPDKRDYLRDYHPDITFFPKNVRLNAAKPWK